jgi:hypothetical protein
MIDPEGLMVCPNCESTFREQGPHWIFALISLSLAALFFLSGIACAGFIHQPIVGGVMILISLVCAGIGSRAFKPSPKCPNCGAMGVPAYTPKGREILAKHAPAQPGGKHYGLGDP